MATDPYKTLGNTLGNYLEYMKTPELAYYVPGQNEFTYARTGQAPTNGYLVSETDIPTDYNSWLSSGAALNEYGSFDSSASDWWKHPAASSYYSSLGSNYTPQQGQYAIPDWAQSAWGSDPGGFANWWGGLDTDTRDRFEAMARSNYATQQGSNANIDSTIAAQLKAANSLDEPWQQYLQKFGTAQGDEIRTLQNAIANYQGSEAAGYLSEMADPNYQVLTDRDIAIQKAAASRAIQKAQADAVNAAVSKVTDAGLHGGPLSAQLKAAAGFRAGNSQATLNADLDMRQITENYNARKDAIAKLSSRDSEIAGLNESLAQARGRTPVPNPYAAQQAEMMSDAQALALAKTFEIEDFGDWITQKEVDEINNATAIDRDTQERILTIAEDKWEEQKKTIADEREKEEKQQAFDDMMNSIGMGLNVVETFIKIFPWLNG